MMSTANIATHVLPGPGGDRKELQGQATNDQRPILTWTQQTNALPSRPSHEWTLASCTLQEKMCNVFSLGLPQTSCHIQRHPYPKTTIKVVTSMDWMRGAPCKNKRKPSTFCTMHSMHSDFHKPAAVLDSPATHMGTSTHYSLGEAIRCTMHHISLGLPQTNSSNPATHHWAYETSTGTSLLVPPMMNTANITTHGLPSRNNKEP